MPNKIIISELWPHVASVKIKTHQIDRSEFSFHEEYASTMRYRPYSSAEFRFKCINRECNIGYFDLYHIVASMCNKHEVNCDGTLDGHSNEVKYFDNHCKCHLDYSITIEYCDNK